MMGDPEIPEEPEYDLVMPFVAVTSRGGPYDDDAYTAGWEAGRLDATLATAPPTHQVTIHAENGAQADLIAMRHHYRCTVEDSGTDGWVYAMFTPLASGGDQ